MKISLCLYASLAEKVRIWQNIIETTRQRELYLIPLALELNFQKICHSNLPDTTFAFFELIGLSFSGSISGFVESEWIGGGQRLRFRLDADIDG